MSNIRLIGLTSIKLGTIPASAAMAAALTTIVAIVPDSAHLIIEPPGVTDLYVEEEDFPDMQVLGVSKKTLEFATRDMSTGVLLEAFGGVAATAVWSASTIAIVIRERAVEAISKTINGKKLKIQIPRASVHAGADLRFTKTESGQINFSCEILMPSSSSVISPLVITQV